MLSLSLEKRQTTYKVSDSEPLNWGKWFKSAEFPNFSTTNIARISEFATLRWSVLDSVSPLPHWHVEQMNSYLWWYFNVHFNWCDFLAAGDEGSSSGSGSGCSDGCTTEFVFVGTEAPVIGADRSDEHAAAAAAGKSLSRGPSLLLVMVALTLPLLATQTQRR